MIDLKYFDLGIFNKNINETSKNNFCFFGNVFFSINFFI